MPGMSGLELLGCIRAMDKTVPVILMTAMGTIELVLHVLQAGAVAYLSKPIEREVLITTIEHTLHA
jgi:FixJ family two-component response regulator